MDKKIIKSFVMISKIPAKIGPIPEICMFLYHIFCSLRWIGAAIEPHIASLQAVVQQELRESFGGSGGAQPTRYLRSQQNRVRDTPATDCADGKSISPVPNAIICIICFLIFINHNITDQRETLEVRLTVKLIRSFVI